MNEEKKAILFNEVVQQNKGLLISIVRTYTKTKDEENDLLQEILLQIWLSLERYNRDFKLSTWLYRIGLNVAISSFRSKTRREARNIPLSEDLMQVSSDGEYENNEQVQLLHGFIQELNSVDKALTLLFLEEKSYNEISDILGISVSNVGTKLGRIKEKLRKRFEDFENGLQRKK